MPGILCKNLENPKKEAIRLENCNGCLEIVLQFFEITVPISGVAAPGFPFLVSEPELDHINRAVTFVPVTR